jgi:hypothetical protein
MPSILVENCLFVLEFQTVARGYMLLEDRDFFHYLLTPPEPLAYRGTILS